MSSPTEQYHAAMQRLQEQRTRKSRWLEAPATVTPLNQLRNTVEDRGFARDVNGKRYGHLRPAVFVGSAGL